MGAVDDFQHEILIFLGVADEFSAQIGPEPGPLAFGAAGTVDGDKTASLMDVVLEGVFLVIVVEGFIVGVVEDEDVVFGDIFEGEDGGVVGDVAEPVVFPADVFEAFGGGGDVLVNVAFAVFGVNEDVFLSGAAGKVGQEQGGGQDESQNGFRFGDNGLGGHRFSFSVVLVHKLNDTHILEEINGLYS